MTPERWQQVERVLDAVLDEPPSAWPRLVDDACAGDPELHRAVEALLHCYPEATHFLQTPVAVPAAEDTRAAPASLEGRHIGPYRLLHTLARGGMADVYLAERTTEAFEQRVAFKLLRPGLDSEDARRRFRAERQILAALDHPGIARLFDVGLTNDGQPYLVMEYVDGLPIDQYCDRHRLSVHERLDLFVTACAGVHYAHRNLVVHRDLKPSNILVTPEKHVKLLDFGIAKLLRGETVPFTLPQTRTGQRWMTPEYAAPEQIRGAAITTATDVYQLGVILYELLTGRRPFERETDSVYAIEQAVLTTEPEKPSTLVTRVAEQATAEGTTFMDAEQISQARSTRPEQLRKTLQGDLDIIVLKALRKEPDARYASVEAFVEDVKRYLGGLPVQARHGTLAYRARKFARRHQWGIAVAAVFVLLLTGYALTVTVQANRIASERDRAEQATALMADLFHELEPVETPGSTLEARDILDRGVERIRREIPDQSLLRAKLMDTIGRVYENWGLFAEAEPLLEEALTIRQRLLGSHHLDVADSQLELAILRYTTGHPGTDSLFQAAITTYRDQLGPEHSQTVWARTNRAIALRARGAYAAAEALFREILATTPQDETNTNMALARIYLGKLLTRKGAYDEADGLLRDALATRRAVSGAVHPVVANILDARGELMLARGDPDAAEQLFQEALAMRRHFFEDDHPDIATSFANLALTRHARGAYAEAETLLHEALAAYRRTFGQDSPDIAKLLRHLAATRKAQSDSAGAMEYLQEAIAIWRSQPRGTTHPEMVAALNDLAALQADQETGLKTQKRPAISR